MQGLYLKLLDLTLDLVLKPYAREGLPRLVVPAFSDEDVGKLRHEEQEDDKHDGEEDVATVGDAPAVGNFGEEDVDGRDEHCDRNRAAMSSVSGYSVMVCVVRVLPQRHLLPLLTDAHRDRHLPQRPQLSPDVLRR